MTIFRLTFLSNVVVYACRPSSRKDRHDIHQHRRLTRRIAIGGSREYDARVLPSVRPWPPNERRKGRKGRKTSNRPERRALLTMPRSGGNRRKLAETPFQAPMAVRKYSWRGREKQPLR